MSWQEGAAFRIIGCVFDVFVSDSKKFAKVKIDVQEGGKSRKIEMKCFDRSVIGEIASLRKGQRVQVRGKIESEKLTARDRSEVKVDGFAVWIPALRPATFEVEGSSGAPAPRESQAPAAAPAAAGETQADDDAFAPSGGFDGDGD